MDGERIAQLREMHFRIEEPDYGTMDPDPPLISICSDDGSTWPCGTSVILDALADARAENARLAIENRMLATHLKVRHMNDRHGLAWDECDAPGCEDARAALAPAAAE